MNIESETKEIIRMDGTAEERAERICRRTSFKKENVVTAIKKGGETVSVIYRNLILLEKKE